MFQLEIEAFLVGRSWRLWARLARVGHVLRGQLFSQRDGRVERVLVLGRNGSNRGHPDDDVAGESFRLRLVLRLLVLRLLLVVLIWLLLVIGGQD